MNQKISVLAPEPIKLVEEDDVADNVADFVGGFKSSFQRVYVSDCTIVNGENGNRFAVWKVTMVLQNSQDMLMCNPHIVTYMRYSDFVHFRDLLAQRTSSQHIEIPKLPPTIKWYESWRYQNVNLNKKWLAKRRLGLEYFLNHVMLNKDLYEVAKELILEFMDKKRSLDR